MNILLLSWRGPDHPHAGGAELVTHEHAKAWVKKGHKVTLFTSSFIKAKEEEIVDGVKIIRKGNEILSVQWEAFKWYLMTNKQTFDLVIDQFHGLPFFTPLYIKTKKIAFIHEVTKEVWSYNVLKEPFHSLVSFVGQLGEPWMFKLFYLNVPFWTVSNSTKTELIDFGISSSNITIIHNGVSILKVKKVLKKPAITFIGAIAADKGIEDAIKVFALLKNTKFTFWVIGRFDSNYINKIKSLVKKLHLEKRVKFWGYVSEKKKFDLLNQSYLVINPSIREGWGLTVIESASVGTPTIAYPVSGLKDAIVHQETGLLTDTTSPESIYEAVCFLIDNPDKYKEMQENAYKWSQKFDWRKSTAQSIKYIENSIDS